MSKFVMGLLVVQTLLGFYQFGFTSDAGRPESNARATRLPSSTVFGHMVLSGLILFAWIGHLASGHPAWAWGALALLVLSALSGFFMVHRTVLKPVTVPSTSPDPADHLVAEKRIPLPAIAMHGIIAAVIDVCVLLVALGVFD